MPVLRVTWRFSNEPPRLLSEDEFINEIKDMVAQDFRGVPGGPVLVQALEEGSTVSWSGYYQSAASLMVLLRQLVAEREIATHSRLVPATRGETGGSQ